MESWAEMSIFACVRRWNRGNFERGAANFVVSFHEWKQKHSQRPPRAFHVKRNVNSKLVSCFVSTFECHAKQPPKSRCFVSPRFSCFNSGPIRCIFCPIFTKSLKNGCSYDRATSIPEPWSVDDSEPVASRSRQSYGKHRISTSRPTHEVWF